MGLDKLNKKQPTEKEGWGYQVFSVRGKRASHYAVGPDKKVYNGDIRLGCIARVKAGDTITCNLLQKRGNKKEYFTYEPGFHVWTDKKDALNHLYWMTIMNAGKEGRCALRKVHYDGAFAEGTIDGAPVVVVKKVVIQQPERDDDDTLKAKRRIYFAHRKYRRVK